MAKRMTATEKWDKEWFCDLTPKQKCIWDYLIHKCDNAGIWDINFGLMSYSIDKNADKITEKDLEIFGERLIKFSEDKIFIPSFINFQYGILVESCKPHIPVLAKLKKYGLLKLLEFKGYKYPSQRVKEKEKDKEKEMDKEKEKENGEKFEIIYPFSSEDFTSKWDVWKKFKQEQFSFKYKPIGEQGALKELSELSEGSEEKAIKIIMQSIQKGWKGFFNIQQNGRTKTTDDELKAAWARDKSSSSGR